MKQIGFDNDKYLSMQSAHIRERISQFGDKLYLEFGGKLFDDYHASRVLPGFAPDSKLQMLLQLADQAEMIISINASDIERNLRSGCITSDRCISKETTLCQQRSYHPLRRTAIRKSVSKKIRIHRYPGLSPLYYRWISKQYRQDRK